MRRAPRVAIVGTGYVGLTTGACLAELGADVTCADIDDQKVASLSSGVLPIHEAGLEHLLKTNLDRGRLRFMVGSAEVAADRDVVFLCLPTPQGSDGSADLSYLLSAAREIAPHLAPETIVVNKSTVPVGSTRLVAEAMGRADIHVASNPEFLREGSAVADFMSPDRVVIGADDETVASRVAALYLRTRAPILVTDAASAETIKYAANAFLATKLSFVNEMAGVCGSVGADVVEVMRGIGYDRRIGHEFLRPGPGWGGSCFPKDTRAMLHIAKDHGHEMTLLRSAVTSNEQQFDRVANEIAELADCDLAESTVGVLGLTFKAGTDDLRDSPSLQIIDRLLGGGATVRAYDPTVRTPDIDGIHIVHDAYAASEGVDVLVVLTEWDEFRYLDLDKLANQMQGNAVFDARNILDAHAVRQHGLTYAGIGRN